MNTNSQRIRQDDGSLYEGFNWVDLNNDKDAEDTGEVAAPLSFERGSTVKTEIIVTSSADFPGGNDTITGTAAGWRILRSATR